MLQGWVALDAQNNRTTIRLSNQRFNAPVSRRNVPLERPARGNAAKLTANRDSFIWRQVCAR